VRIIEAAVSQHGLDAELPHVVGETESGYRAEVVSPASVIGLMQTLPNGAAIYGMTEPPDPTVNLDTGARNLRRLLDCFNGDLAFGLAAYHACPSALRSRHAMPACDATRPHVCRVTGTWKARNAARID
jgi:soluble lytic murein transglycosylase-like protein